MISVENISKSYKDVKALSNVSFNVDEGELFGLIGPDGSGKTTLMRIMVSLILPDTGKILLDKLDTDKDFKKIRSIIGYMPGKFSLYMDLTVKENIDFYSNVFGVSYKKNYSLISDVYDQLAPFENRRAGQLSGGMKQKLALCCALIHKPKMLFLDEPTTGVDAVSRKEFWDMIYKLRADGMTIVASTPYMDEAERCDRIALFQNGNILEIDTPKQLVAKYEGKVIALVTPQVNKCIKLLKYWKKVHIAYLFGDTIHLTMNDKSEPISSVTDYLHENKIDVTSIEFVNPNIEDCYIYLNYNVNPEHHSNV
ncbi:MAG: ABC transporter ATP-binding protein [Bacteroidales bacterium]|jgi:ABC-type multidrug transport system ATPase subunit|nr:ABC transporter ATP-binding protein [Bacteroidales bacterium]